jgi:ribosomal protein L31E
MAEEKIINLNLRKELAGTPEWKRKQTAVRILRKVLFKHAKGKIKIESKLNEEVWSGKKKLRVKLIKTEDGFKAELA